MTALLNRGFQLLDFLLNYQLNVLQVKHALPIILVIVKAITGNCRSGAAAAAALICISDAAGELRFRIRKS
jgi:hypothetical protein